MFNIKCVSWHLRDFNLRFFDKLFSNLSDLCQTEYYCFHNDSFLIL